MIDDKTARRVKAYLEATSGVIEVRLHPVLHVTTVVRKGGVDTVIGAEQEIMGILAAEGIDMAIDFNCESVSISPTEEMAKLVGEDECGSTYGVCDSCGEYRQLNFISTASLGGVSMCRRCEEGHPTDEERMSALGRLMSGYKQSPIEQMLSATEDGLVPD